MNSILLRRYIRVILENDQPALDQQSSEETLKNTDIFTLLGEAQEDPAAFLELYYTDRFEDIKKEFDPAAAAKLIACLRKGLSSIGIGSSRVVFEYDVSSVIKISINAAGVKQNQLEHTVSSDPIVGPIIARVLNHDDDFQWIISEKVKPISSEAQFTLLSGIEHKNFKEEILALNARDLKENQDKENNKTRADTRTGARTGARTGTQSADYSSLPPDFISTIKQGKGCLSGKEFLNDVKAFLTRYKINATTGSETDFFVGDIYKYESWGVNNAGCLVLFDYGTTNNTYKKFFKKGSFSGEKAKKAITADNKLAKQYDQVRNTRLPNAWHHEGQLSKLS